jgi:AcrR family transcriptional regulator
MGLRELKKEQTRQQIADTAWELFVDRGFDQVSVAEVAQEAQVAQATVYNYFHAKEDIFYWRMEAFGTRLAEVVATRPPGESALAAFRRALLADNGLLAQAETGDTQALDRIRTINRLFAASPALLAREQQTLNQAAGTLADVLAADAATFPGDLRPQVAANALIGVHRALLDHVRRRGQSGEVLAGLAAEVRKLATEAFDVLEQGLCDYAAKPPDLHRAGVVGFAQAVGATGELLDRDVHRPAIAACHAAERVELDPACTQDARPRGGTCLQNASPQVTAC